MDIFSTFGVAYPSMMHTAPLKTENITTPLSGPEITEPRVYFFSRDLSRNNVMSIIFIPPENIKSCAPKKGTQQNERRPLRQPGYPTEILRIFCGRSAMRFYHKKLYFCLDPWLCVPGFHRVCYYRSLFKITNKLYNFL
jgi:hypothetical protein